MVRNPGEKSERIVGSALLINTAEINTGRPVVVIRGINPIQRFISQVDVDDFMNNLFGYVRQIASDRDVAVVSDDHSGGAASNRPEVFDWLKQRYYDNKGKTRTPLKLPKDTTFNKYILSSKKHPAFYI